MVLKNLEIDFYADGYKGQQIDCVDLPIAAASGYHHYDYYFYYCFYVALWSNWRKPEDASWLKDREAMMARMGLSLVSHDIRDEAEMLAAVRKRIDEQAPIVLMVSYFTLFYIETYMSDNRHNHGLLINAYDPERNIFVIRERHLGNKVTKDFMKGDPFFKLQLKEEHLADIWTKSNDYFKETGSFFANRMFSVARTGDTAIRRYADVAGDFAKNGDMSFSVLAHTIEHRYEELSETIQDEVEAMFFRRKYFGSVSVLFDVLDKALGCMSLTENEIGRYRAFRDDYVRFKDLLIARIYADALRSKPMPHDEKLEIVDRIRAKDRMLHDLVRELYEASPIMEPQPQR